jgi:hypothetical protein
MRKMLGPRPIIFGESPRDYDFLHRSVSEELQPIGIIENLLVKDITTASWFVQRADRFTERLVHLTLPDAARKDIGQRLAKMSTKEGASTRNSDERIADGVELKAIYMTIGLARDYHNFVELMEGAGFNHDDLAVSATLLQQKAFKMLDDQRQRYVEARRRLLGDLERRQQAMGRGPGTPKVIAQSRG